MMTFHKIKFSFYYLLICSFCGICFGGKIVYPWRSTTAIVLPGGSFEVWFDADSGQTVNSVELQGPYNTVYPTKSITTGNWEYDQMSGNRYDTRITVTVPANAPADRYDLVLKTSSGDVFSYGGVKVIADYKTTYYIMHISDGHLYQSGYDTDVLLARKSAMIDIANIMDVQIIIETGDNMYNVRNHPEREGYYFLGNPGIGTKGMAKASAATFLTPGDHDAYAANDWTQSTAQVNADFFNDYWGMQNHCFKYGNGRFMTLNNAWAVSASNPGDHAYQIDQAVAWLSGAGSGGNFFLTAGHCYDKMHGFIDDHKALDLVLAGDKHHVRTDNPWPFETGSAEVAYIAGSIRDHFEFNLYQVNNSAGTFTTPSGITGVANVLYSGSQDTPTTWIRNIELTYSQLNNGQSAVNSATIINRYSFPIAGARVRFVMPRGSTYVVSQGVIKQTFDGDLYHIVDVSIDLSANSTTTIAINAFGIPEGASARGENPPNETAGKAFDGSSQTKWLDFSPTGSWIQYRYADGATKIVTRYAITSANDAPARDPKDWNLLGSKDGGLTWSTLDSRTGIIFLNRFETKFFSVSNPGEYNSYRLQITAVRDAATANSVQLAEIQLLSCFGLSDLDCDGRVDISDFSYMAGVWLTNDPKADIAAPAGQVDVQDLLVLVQEWLSDSLIDGAVAYWKLDETTGLVAPDYSVNSHHGTLMNMDNSDWVAGKLGNALSFDGVND
ncbi:MAG: discoidin domain-containing protein [Planctomycetes bacterium]|nr:discoidin domain-containing protein [Planctomycetota bacterium]